MIRSEYRHFKTIIFDLGNVIIDLNWENWLDSFSVNGFSLTINDLNKLANRPYFLDFEIGQLTSEELLFHANKEFRTSWDINKFVPKWNGLLGSIPQSKLLMMEKLKDNHRVLILSNTNQIHQAEFDRRIHELTGKRTLNELVHRAYYSHHLGLRKPDKAIFTKLLELEDTLPEDIIFFDDTQENIDAAREIGIKGILIEHPEKLWDYFER